MEVGGGALALESGMEGENVGEGMDGEEAACVDWIWRASAWESFGGMRDALARTKACSVGAVSGKFTPCLWLILTVVGWR